jgi:hypothetical protein
MRLKFMKHYRWLFSVKIDFSVSVISGGICLHLVSSAVSIPQLGGEE